MASATREKGIGGGVGPTMERKLEARGDNGGNERDSGGGREAAAAAGSGCGGKGEEAEATASKWEQAVAGR
uniref:Uncharacterized protein n=1 Tax=Oryza rufipogon TaxID=4529 RepID=A0A0E0NWK5_ORYRU